MKTSSKQPAKIKIFFCITPTNETKLNTIQAHLISEELLTKNLCKIFPYGNYLETAKLNFYQKLTLNKAFLGEKMPDGLFGSLKNLNKIRNKHAHALYPEGIIDLENSLILSTPVATKKKKSSFNKKEVHLEKSREEKYAEALKWILGETIDLTSLSPDSHLKA